MSMRRITLFFVLVLFVLGGLAAPVSLNLFNDEDSLISANSAWAKKDKDKKEKGSKKDKKKNKKKDKKKKQIRGTNRRFDCFLIRVMGFSATSNLTLSI